MNRKTKLNILSIKVAQDPSGSGYAKLEGDLKDSLGTDKNLVFLDCSATESFYSQVQAIIALYGRRLLELGKELILVNVSKRLFKQLEVSGLNRVIKVFPLEEEALLALEQWVDKKEVDDFKISLADPAAGRQTLTLSGMAIDLRCKERIKEALQRVKWTEVKELQIDMSSLDFLDSSSMGVLVWANIQAEKTGSKIAVTGANSVIQDLFRISNLKDMLSPVPAE
jgi:anti-anti-sigma factor